MKITIEKTSKIVEVNGIPSRIWEGHTDTGIAVHCFVTRIAVCKDADQTQFEAELEAQIEPTKDVQAYPPRMIL